MSEIIQVKDLSKSYMISHEGRESYTALRDVMANKAKGALSFMRKKEVIKTKEEFWALKDVSFDIQRGDRVGIIGRNGAGKSTLLKILSRITEPTTGSIKIKGRVASLLEVGTGFHPELTGRENIFLNGAILGMSRAEIRKHFDAIVDFAEIEKFLDTPVKRYSSGMYVRLAFAVAAHLEPEILVVDEVLAVGDAAFQKKCLGKLEDVSKNEGRTVLFVSHNLGMIRKLCSQGIYLRKGRNIFNGSMNDVISKYLGENEENELINNGHFDLSLLPNKKGSYGIMEADILCNGIHTSEVVPGSDLCIRMKVKKAGAFKDPEFGIVIKDSEMEPLIGINNNHLGVKYKNVTSNEIEVEFRFSKFKIYGQGKYFVNLYFGDEDLEYESLFDAFSFQIIDYDIYGSGIILDRNWNKLIDDSLTISVR